MRTAWLITVAAGLSVVGLATVLIPMFPAEGAGFAVGYGEPVYAFEMARTKGDLIAVFGSVDDPGRPLRISSMDRGNRLDFAFAFAYGTFVVLFFVAAFLESGKKSWLVFACLGIVAAFADVIENFILLGLTADLEAAPNLGLLAYPVWTKFLALMVAGAAAGAYLISDHRTHWSLLGSLAAAGALTVLAAFYSNNTYGWTVGIGITICWSAQLAYAIAMTLRPQADN